MEGVRFYWGGCPALSAISPGPSATRFHGGLAPGPSPGGVRSAWRQGDRSGPVAQSRSAEMRDTASEPSEGALKAVAQLGTSASSSRTIIAAAGPPQMACPVARSVAAGRGEPRPIGPLDLLVAGSQFQRAADAAQSPLQADFSAAADQLFQAGLQRMEDRRA